MIKRKKNNMKNLQLYYNDEYVITRCKEDFSDRLDIPEQTKVFSTIMFRLMGSGVIDLLSEYLSKRLSVDTKLIYKAISDYIDNNSL
jgi:hypothetical protein